MIEDGSIRMGLPRSEEVIENVLAFLDNFFGRGDIERPADKEKILYTNLRWNSIYDKYVQHCNKLRLNSTNQNKFCEIR